MGSTVNYGWTTPEGGDLIRLGDNVIRQALIDADADLKAEADARAAEDAALAADIASFSPVARGIKAYRNGATSPASGAWTLVTWDAEVWDTHAHRDNVSNPARIFLGETGRWRIDARVKWAVATGGTLRAAQLRLNAGGNVALGSELDRSDLNHLASSAYVATLRLGAVSWFTAGDALEVFCYQNSGAALGLDTGQHSTWISAEKVP